MNAYTAKATLLAVVAAYVVLALLSVPVTAVGAIWHWWDVRVFFTSCVAGMVALVIVLIGIGMT